MKEIAFYRWVLRLIGLIGLIGIGKYANWQTAVLLFVVLWANSVDQRDMIIRELSAILRKRR